jgi:SOS response regulatory protein OraA/RecX
MIKSRYIAASIASVGVLGFGALGIASAATPAGTTTKSTTIGTSGIPRTTFKQDRLSASAQVLNTTSANVQAAQKNKTLSQLITKAALTKKTYGEKLKAQLTSALEKQGYSQDQVTIALQHRTIERLRHDHK